MTGGIMAKTTAILSLDGGGTWALIQARTLQRIYGDMGGHAILRHFDWAVANSGGSIVLGGLMLDWSPARIISYFENHQERAAIFDDRFFSFVTRLLGVGPRYKTTSKGARLHAIFAEAPFAPLLHADGHITQMIMVAYDYDRARAALFRTQADSLAANHGVFMPVRIWEAVHASTTAPVNYFNAPAVLPGTHDRRYWDGGLTGHNNPALIGIAEALCNGRRANDIAVLSIGTGTTLRPAATPDATSNKKFVIGRKRSSLLRDIIKVAGSITADPPDFSSFLAHVMLGGTVLAAGENIAAITDGPIVRMNPLVTPFWDGKHWTHQPGQSSDATLASLIDLDMDATSDTGIQLIVGLCTAWLQNAVPNQAIRGHFPLPDGAARTYIHEIGHAQFGAALAQWNAIKPR
jgi:uncharacterized protein